MSEMTKGGAAIGFVIGLAGGLVGAVIGLILGALIAEFIENMNNDDEVGTAEIHNGDLYDEIWFSFFKVLGKFAKADGSVSKQEIKVFQNFVESNFEDIGSESKILMQKMSEAHFTIGRDSDLSLADLIRQYHSSLKAYQTSSVSIKEQNIVLYNVLKELAQANIPPSDIHFSLLNEISLQLGIEVKSNYSSFESPEKDDTNYLKKYYELLKLNENATVDEIKLARRRRLAEFHPDKHAAKDLPEDFMKFANDMVIKVNEAYEAIMASKNFNKN